MSVEAKTPKPWISTQKHDALVLRNSIVQESTNLTSWKVKKVTYYSYILTVDMMARESEFIFFTFRVLEKTHAHFLSA